MSKNDERIAEIKSLGAQKRDAYMRLDELETQLRSGGMLATALRALLPGKASRAKRREYNETRLRIHALRNSMDELRALLPSEKLAEAEHLWDFEHTTSLSQLREAGRG